MCNLQPAANGRGEEIANINVTLPGGGRPIEFDANGTNPTVGFQDMTEEPA